MALLVTWQKGVDDILREIDELYDAAEEGLTPEEKKVRKTRQLALADTRCAVAVLHLHRTAMDVELKDIERQLQQLEMRRDALRTKIGLADEAIRSWGDHARKKVFGEPSNEEKKE